MGKLLDILQEIQIKGGPTWEEVYKLYHEIIDPMVGVNNIKLFEIKDKLFTYLKERTGKDSDLSSLLKALDKRYLPEIYHYLKKYK